MFIRRMVRSAAPTLLALALLAPEADAAGRGSPSAPGNLRITASTSASVTLAWDASKSGTGVSYYTVMEKTTWNFFNVPASQTTFTRTRLAPNISYAWVVYTVDKSGHRSADSNTVTYRTPPDVTPPSAPVLSAPFVGPTRVLLDWTDSVDEVSGVRYAVSVNGSATATAYESQMVVPGLAPSTSYTFRVTASDNSGNTSTSNSVTVTTPAADNRSAPTAPPNLVGSEVGGCEGWLSWDASTDDVDPPAAIRYDAYVNGEFDSWAFGTTRTIVYARATGTNTFTIVAVDSSGNESAPSTVAIPNMFVC